MKRLGNTLLVGALSAIFASGVLAVAQIVSSLPFTLQNNTVADATQVMANFNQIVNNVNANGAKNGTNSDITALVGLTTPLTPAQGGTSFFTGGTSTGTANAQVVSPTVPTTFSLAAPNRLVFIAGFTNTGATTLNAASTGATNVFRNTPEGPLALVGGEIIAGQAVVVTYDGTQYQLLNPSTYEALSNDAGAALAPSVSTFRNSASPAASDFIGSYDFYGRDSAANKQLYGQIVGQITDPTSTTEDAILILRAQIAGVLTDMLKTSATGITIPGSLAVTGDFTAANSKAMTKQYLLSGTAATYTTPSSPTPRTIVVKMVAGGGGGAAVTTNAGGTGGTTSFNSITAIGGTGGAIAVLGGAGGTGGAGSASLRLAGSYGGNGAANSGDSGGYGGTGPFGGAGRSGGNGTAGTAAAANTGAGGAGGSSAGGASAGGGGSGEYVEFIITSPAASYTYTVGAAGTGGAAGGVAGTNGGSGHIVVEEYYKWLIPANDNTDVDLLSKAA